MRMFLACIVILLSTYPLFSEEIYIEKKANINGREITYDWDAFEGPYKISEAEFYEKLGLYNISYEIREKNRKYSIIGWGSFGVMIIGSAMSLYPLTVDNEKLYENKIHISVGLFGLASMFGGMIGVFWADGHRSSNKTPYSYAHDMLNK